MVVASAEVGGLLQDVRGLSKAAIRSGGQAKQLGLRAITPRHRLFACSAMSYCRNVQRVIIYTYR
jgi:hypothetical protein